MFWMDIVCTFLSITILLLFFISFSNSVYNERRTIFQLTLSERQHSNDTITTATKSVKYNANWSHICLAVYIAFDACFARLRVWQTFNLQLRRYIGA